MILWFSLPNIDAEETEFWNRDDEASASDEDISDSDGISLLITNTYNKLHMFLFTFTFFWKFHLLGYFDPLWFFLNHVLYINMSQA